jgi:glutamate racemase
MLLPVLRTVMGEGTVFIDAGAAGAGSVARLLDERGLRGGRERGRLSICVSDESESFESAASRFLGEDVSGMAEKVVLG